MMISQSTGLGIIEGWHTQKELRPSGPRLCGLLSFVSFKGLSSPVSRSVCFYGLHNNGGTLLSFLSSQWKGYMLAARMRMPSSSLLRFYVMKLLENTLTAGMLLLLLEEQWTDGDFNEIRPICWDGNVTPQRMKSKFLWNACKTWTIASLTLVIRNLKTRMS